MADAITFVFRFFHVLGGVMWIGGAFLWIMLLAPRILKNGPPAIRRPFLETVLAPFSRYMNIAAVVTILTGFVTMGLIVGWDSLVSTFQNGGAYGMALGVGVVAALALALEGNLVIQPTARKMLAVMQSMKPDAPPPAELPMLGKKMAMASMISLALGTIALGAMVWAVNAVR